MPCHSFNLPASECKVGSKLQKIEGSSCHGCYAMKGFYRMPVVKAAMHRKLSMIMQDDFVSVMVFTINKKEKSGYFRWHDSGDLQSLEHFEKIITICKATPHIKHWLPTRERKIVNSYKGEIPDNLTIRISSTMIDVLQDDNKHVTSTIHKDKPAFGAECEAYKNDNQCGSCRICWDKTVKNISYKKH